MTSSLNPTIQKLASTAFSRWFARNSTKPAAQFGKSTPQNYMQLYGKVNKKTGKLDVTPKMIAKAEYEIAKKNSGKTGRDAFRQVDTDPRSNSRGKKIGRISTGDALGEQPAKKSPRSLGDYATEIAKRRRKLVSAQQGVKDAKGRIKASISKNPKITQNARRVSNVRSRGVGDLDFGSAKEVLDKRRKSRRVESLTPEQLEKSRKRKRVENLTPEQVERKRKYHRVENMTPEQLEKSRKRQLVENMTPEQINRIKESKRKYRRKKLANKAMDKLLEKHNLIKKATYLVKQAQLQTSTIKSTRPVVSGFTKSMDKVVGQGSKTIKAGRLTNSTPAVKNVANAIKTTKGMTSGGSTTVAPLAKTAASRLTKHLAKMLKRNPKIEATKAYKKLKKNFADHDVSGTAYNNELKNIFPKYFDHVDFNTPYHSGSLTTKQMVKDPYAMGLATHDLKRGGIINPLTRASKQIQEYLKKHKDFKPSTKHKHEYHKKKNLGNLTKESSHKGTEIMSSSHVQNAYHAGAYDALTKVANIGQMGMPPQQAPQPQDMGMPVAPQMGAIQQDMGAPLPEQPVPAATVDEMQQVQNSGLTSKDIESAAKVIQTVAEMKANADMMQMQPQDPAALGQPMMAGGGKPGPGPSQAQG